MRTLVTIILIATLALPASAQDYTLGFFTDEDASSCEIYNTTDEVVRVHMLLYGTADMANTTSFYAPTPPCWDAVWLGDEINDDYLFIGTSHGENGIVITFRACRELPLRLGSMSFWATGSDPCCTYEAFPSAAGAGIIEAIDCNLGVHAATHESVVINPDETCSCTASSVVATTPSTWGKVKALYR